MKKIVIGIIIILFLVPFFSHSFKFFKEIIGQRKKVVSGKQKFVGGDSKVFEVPTRLKSLTDAIVSKERKEGIIKVFNEKTSKVVEKPIEEVKAKKQKYESDIHDDILGYRLNSKNHIKQIQTALMRAGFYKGEIDGKAGKGTSRAIKEFQKAKKLNPDGVVGPKTWETLEKYLKN